MVDLITSLRALKPVKALVVGDLVLDTYVEGGVGRISPEAPVQVLRAEKVFSKPGMAGNVALNLAALGASVHLCGRIGFDSDGAQLKSHLEKNGIDCSLLFKQKAFKTPIKQRIIASNQQLLRVDYELCQELRKTAEKTILQKIANLIETIHVIAISDYLKGFLTPSFLNQLIQMAKRHKVPIVVDPKGKDFSKYNGVDLIKPNLSEAYVASHLEAGAHLDEIASVLLETSKAKELLITRSKEGMTLYKQNKHSLHIPTKAKEVIDVTGAGDTVLSVLTVALGSGLNTEVGAKLANIAASIVIKKVGCAKVTIGEMAEDLLDIYSECKIFNEDSLFALTEALKQTPFGILALSENFCFDLSFFKIIKSLKLSRIDQKLILYIPSESLDHETLSALASLHEVDFIIEKTKSIQALAKTLTPDYMFVLKGSKLTEFETPDSLLAKLKISKNTALS